MKTDQLITAMVADGPARPSRWRFAPLLVGGAATLVVALVCLDFRPDLAVAAGSVRFTLKIGVMILLAAVAGWLLFKARGPQDGPAASRYTVLLVPLLLLTAGCIAEMAITPASEWGQRALGTNSRQCLTMIPLIALPVLAGTILALRRWAPARPSHAGALAGLVAGAVAASLYGFACVDDSPLFVAIWYAVAIGVMATLGAGAGRVLLRW